MMRFGLIGHPIGHSLSPALFSAAYAGQFCYDLIEGPDFEESYARFLSDYDGINVTTPFKEQAFAKADRATDECRAIAACNVLVKREGEVLAYNSDCLGVRQCMCEAGLKAGSCVMVAGCGGAGKAAAVAAAGLGMRTIVLNRTMEKAEAFVDHARAEGMAGLEVASMDRLAELYSQCDMLIYTLPRPVAALDEIAGAGDGKRRIILEANYRDPAFSDGLRTRFRDTEFIRGERWLLHQASTIYGVFTDIRPDVAAMKKILECKLGGQSF